MTSKKLRLALASAGIGVFVMGPSAPGAATMRSIRDLEGAAKAYDDAVFIEDSLAYMEPPYWYYPVRQSLAAVRLRQGKLDEAEQIFRQSLARVRNNAWALAGLDETYRRKGDAAAEKATRQAFAKAWLGNPAGPPIDRL